MSQIRERVAALLLEELKADGSEEWYYISIVNTVTNTFVGGYFLKAKGPTDAWTRMHALNWCPRDCETQTHGPLPISGIARVPLDWRWRRLTREELETIQ